MSRSMKVQEFKWNIDDEDYTFRLDFNALDKYYSRFKENSMRNLESIMKGEGFYYKHIVNLLECSCKEREFEQDELRNKIGMDFATLQELDMVGVLLLGELFSTKENKENTEKN